MYPSHSRDARRDRGDASSPSLTAPPAVAKDPVSEYDKSDGSTLSKDGCIPSNAWQEGIAQKEALLIEVLHRSSTFSPLILRIMQHFRPRPSDNLEALWYHTPPELETTPPDLDPRGIYRTLTRSHFPPSDESSEGPNSTGSTRRPTDGSISLFATPALSQGVRFVFDKDMLVDLYWGHARQKIRRHSDQAYIDQWCRAEEVFEMSLRSFNAVNEGQHVNAIATNLLGMVKLFVSYTGNFTEEQEALTRMRRYCDWIPSPQPANGSSGHGDLAFACSKQGYEVVFVSMEIKKLQFLSTFIVRIIETLSGRRDWDTGRPGCTLRMYLNTLLEEWHWEVDVEPRLQQFIVHVLVQVVEQFHSHRTRHVLLTNYHAGLLFRLDAPNTVAVSPLMHRSSWRREEPGLLPILIALTIADPDHIKGGDHLFVTPSAIPHPQSSGPTASGNEPLSSTFQAYGAGSASWEGPSSRDAGDGNERTPRGGHVPLHRADSDREGAFVLRPLADLPALAMGKYGPESRDDVTRAVEEPAAAGVTATPQFTDYFEWLTPEEAIAYDSQQHPTQPQLPFDSISIANHPFTATMLNEMSYQRLPTETEAPVTSATQASRKGASIGQPGAAVGTQHLPPSPPRTVDERAPHIEIADQMTPPPVVSKRVEHMVTPPSSPIVPVYFETSVSPATQEQIRLVPSRTRGPRVLVRYKVGEGRVWTAYHGEYWQGPADATPIPVVVKFASPYRKPSNVGRSADETRSDHAGPDQVRKGCLTEARMYNMPELESILPHCYGFWKGIPDSEGPATSRRAVPDEIYVAILEDVGPQVLIPGTFRWHSVFYADKLAVIRAYTLLHAQGILHGDIANRHIRKAQNVTTGESKVKLIDFEGASMVDASTQRGSALIQEEREKVGSIISIPPAQWDDALADLARIEAA